MKVSLLTLTFLTASQYSSAFVPGSSPRAFAKTGLNAATTDRKQSIVEDPKVYEGSSPDKVLPKDQSPPYPLIQGSTFEDVPMNGKAPARVVNIVRAPLDKVWELARPFGGPELTSWWKIYDDNDVHLDGPDAPGVERTFKVGVRTTSEILAERDDHSHRFVYKMTDAQGYPAGYYGTTTAVSMKATGPNETEVTWEAWSNVHPFIAKTVQEGQVKAYTSAIFSLDNHFHPALGRLDVKVTSLSNVNGKPYVAVKIDGTRESQETDEAHGSNPTFDKTLNFDVFAKKGRLSVAVLDSKRGKDEVIGTAFYDLEDIVTNPNLSEITLPLNGTDTGKISLALKMKPDVHKMQLATLPNRKDDDKRVKKGESFNVDTVKLVVADLANKAFDAIITHNMGKQETISYSRYGRNAQIPNVPMEDLPRAAKGLPFNQQLNPDKLGIIFQRLTEYLYSQVDFALKKQKLTMTKGGDPWTAFFGQYLQPTANTKNIVKNSHTDEELARQYLNGMSPTMISQVQSISEIPDIPLKKVTLDGETLESIIARKGLFYCDYRHLDPLELYLDMFFYAPYVLVYKRKGSEELTMGAIQLEREPNADVFTANKDETADSRWQFAKTHLACADNQYHQFIFHLGYGHLAMEPHIVSIYNNFPEGHIIKQLMTPHFKDTIGINFLARQTLVSEVKPITDSTFAPGTAQAMQMFLAAWKEYDFLDNNFENDLKNRGFTEDRADGVKDYYYREDGFMVWNAIGNYIKKVVDNRYKTDKDVQNDEHIQKWALETSDKDKAAIPGFPTRIFSKELLVTTLQTIIWNLSAAHSAVNFSQYDHLSYIPNRPNTLFEPMPVGSVKDEIPDFDGFVLKSLPDEKISHFEILFSWLLTTPPQVTLSQVDAMSGEQWVPEAHASFQADLARIHKHISSRNEKLAKDNKPNYPYLDPNRIEASIAI